METIYDYTFYACYSLKNITILRLVTSIESNAFESCIGLAIVTIGEGVESIGNHSFQSCSSLECIYYYWESSPTIGINAFSGVPTLYVMMLETH